MPERRTKFRGVTPHNQRPGWWNVRFKAHGKKYSLGAYRSPEKAARVYDAVARRVHGGEAVLNFEKEELPGDVCLADIMLLMRRKGLL